jgi:hypothetical protein
MPFIVFSIGSSIGVPCRWNRKKGTGYCSALSCWNEFLYKCTIRGEVGRLGIQGCAIDQRRKKKRMKRSNKSEDVVFGSLDEGLTKTWRVDSFFSVGL